jgi:hypothetical protein
MATLGSDLRGEMATLGSGLRVDVAELGAGLHADMVRQGRNFMFGTIGIVVAMVGAMAGIANAFAH